MMRLNIKRVQDSEIARTKDGKRGDAGRNSASDNKEIKQRNEKMTNKPRPQAEKEKHR